MVVNPHLKGAYHTTA